MEAITTPLLTGFEIARHITGQSDRIDEEDPHLRVYLHPDRPLSGTKKPYLYLSHDISSLELVLIEIGLWTRFRHMQKYQAASTDQKRQLFAKRLRKPFAHEKSGVETEMGRMFYAVVCYCLSGAEDRSKAEPGAMPEQNSVLLGEPNGMQLMHLLEQQLGRDQGT